MAADAPPKSDQREDEGGAGASRTMVRHSATAQMRLKIINLFILWCRMFCRKLLYNRRLAVGGVLLKDVHQVVVNLGQLGLHLLWEEEKVLGTHLENLHIGQGRVLKNVAQIEKTYFLIYSGVENNALSARMNFSFSKITATCSMKIGKTQ